MKDILLKKDLIAYLIHEIERVKRLLHKRVNCTIILLCKDTKRVNSRLFMTF